MTSTRGVGRQLSRVFGALVLLIVCSGAAGMAGVLVQHRTVRDLTEHVRPLQLANADLRAALADAQRGLRGYLLTGDPQLIDTYEGARDDYAVAAAALRRFAVATDAALITEQVTRADAWWALAQQQRSAVPRSVDAGRYVAEGRPLFEAFVAANSRLDDVMAHQATVLQRRSARLRTGAIAGMGVLTVAAAGLAGLAAARTTRRITRPLGDVVAVLDRLRRGDHASRADPDRGPAEIRAVAEAVNTMADERDRIRDAERDIARLRDELRALGYRIRQHLRAADAVREAVDGLAATMRAERVLLRMAPDETDVPALTSWRDEHVDGPLRALAGQPVTWLAGGDLVCTDDAALPGGATPPEAERRAWERAGGGSVLIVTVNNGDALLGALTVIRTEGPAWTPVEVRLVESVAADLGRGVHHARLYEREQHLVARLRELDHAKSDFMSTVSHELRTPLTSIAGYVEMLRDGDAGELSAAQDRMLDVVARNTRRLRALIEDLLILSRIEAGTFRTAARLVDLTPVVEGALAAAAPAAAKASITLHGDVRGPLPVQADPEQVDRVLTNLLSNAVKFTSADGTVSVFAHRDGDEVVMAVADTGMGIPQAEQPGLFARFFRASNAIHQAVPGTGLGLAIVRTIVDNHAGRLEVRSTEGVGTTVTVRLPARD